jgi:hypothetical protein
MHFHAFRSINKENQRFYTENIIFCRILLIYSKVFCIISLVDFANGIACASEASFDEADSIVAGLQNFI